MRSRQALWSDYTLEELDDLAETFSRNCQRHGNRAYRIKREMQCPMRPELSPRILLQTYPLPGVFVDWEAANTLLEKSEAARAFWWNRLREIEDAWERMDSDA